MPYRSIRVLFSIALCVAACTLTAAAQQPVSEQPKIHVVIIGVPKWQLEDYKASTLGDGITDACATIVKFFRARFTPEQIEFHPDAENPCTEEHTTYAAIRHLLYTDLPSFGKRTLTFVFMMSHGELVHYDNKFVETDLRFITSDTTESDRDGTSISVGVEVLNWLTRMPSGSTVLMFVDTCNAGSVDTLKVQLDQSVQQYYGLKFGVVAASLSDDKAYNADFTRALLKRWQTHPCPTDKRNPDGTTSVYTFENWIHDEIQANAPMVSLEGFEGYPQTIIPFQSGGDWCLGDLSAADKLLFLYQGSEGNVLWKISRQEQGDDFPNPRGFLSTTPFTTRVVPAGHYIVSAQVRGASKVMTFGPIDLESNSTQGRVSIGRPRCV